MYLPLAALIHISGLSVAQVNWFYSTAGSLGKVTQDLKFAEKVHNF